MLGMSSWAPVVSGTAALGAALLVEITRQRGSTRHMRLVAAGLVALAVVGLVAAAFGW